MAFLRKKFSRVKITYVYSKYNYCLIAMAFEMTKWNLVIFTLKFSSWNHKFKERVTFKVREVNYEHFLITIKLEFQKAISNRGWITNWQIVASWIRKKKEFLSVSTRYFRVALLEVRLLVHLDLLIVPTRDSSLEILTK